MLEDVKDKELKAFYKSADYFSADIEVWWNTRFGANYKKFKKILISSKKSSNRTPLAKKALKKSNIKSEDIELIIVASSAPPQLYPAIGCRIQAALILAQCLSTTRRLCLFSQR